jgi:hypothetical protein
MADGGLEAEAAHYPLAQVYGPLRRKDGDFVEEIWRVAAEGIQADGGSSGPSSSPFTAFVTLRSRRGSVLC